MKYLEDNNTTIDKLYAQNSKQSAYKQFQGKVWKDGYKNGHLKCPLYKDVLASLKYWKSNNFKVYIYSSGSREAQQLLLKYTADDGNVMSYIDGFFDTVNAGVKTNVESYREIAKTIADFAERI